MLTVENLSVSYGGIKAVDNISFQVTEGEVVALIGANGAGKTTILRAISGLVDKEKGTVVFKEQPIHNLPPHQIVALGISHVPEGRRVFPLMSVRENLELGAFGRKNRKEILADMELVFAKFPV